MSENMKSASAHRWSDQSRLRAAAACSVSERRKQQWHSGALALHAKVVGRRTCLSRSVVNPPVVCSAATRHEEARALRCCKVMRQRKAMGSSGGRGAASSPVKGEQRTKGHCCIAVRRYHGAPAKVTKVFRPGCQRSPIGLRFMSSESIGGRTMPNPTLRSNHAFERSRTDKVQYS
jgi:hypothetical protein